MYSSNELSMDWLGKRVPIHQGGVRRRKAPLFITDVGWIGLEGTAELYSPTSGGEPKLMTRSRSLTEPPQAPYQRAGLRRDVTDRAPQNLLWQPVADEQLIHELSHEAVWD